MTRVLSVLTIIAAGILFYAGKLFFDYNHPIIKELPAVEVGIALTLVALVILGAYCLISQDMIRVQNRIAGVFLFLLAGLLVHAFLQSAVLDYFQPFSLYDDVIYLTLAGFLMLITRFVVDGVRSLAGREICLSSIGVGFGTLVLVAIRATAYRESW